MTWVKIEQDAAHSSKFFRAGVAAFGWWNAGLGYCNRGLTDGFIPARDLALVMPGTPPDLTLQLVVALVEVRSLHRVNAGERTVCHTKSRHCPRTTATEDGYVMHDFFEHQPRKRVVLKMRRERSKAGRQGGVRSGEQRKQVAEGLLPTRSNPGPVRSDPNPKDKDSKKTRGPEVTLSQGSDRPRQPSADEQLTALAESNGTTPHDMRAAAQALLSETAKGMSLAARRRGSRG